MSLQVDEPERGTLPTTPVSAFRFRKLLKNRKLERHPKLLVNRAAHTQKPAC
jgi:hypothetical protein